MSSLKQLEEKLKEEATKKSLLETLADYFNLWLKEFKNTVWKLLSTPSWKKNQITNELDKWEENLRKN